MGKSYSQGKTENTFIDKNSLMRIYKEMKYQPNKVWVKSDFLKIVGVGKRIPTYLNVLIQLGLVEIVNIVWRSGKRHMIERSGRGGYKIIQGVKHDKKNK